MKSFFTKKHGRQKQIEPKVGTVFFSSHQLKNYALNRKNSIRLFKILSLITVFSCSDVDSNDLNINNPKINQALEKRKAEYAKEILDKCHRDILAKAEIYVDSIISAEINFQLSDSIVFPEKPLKPGWPGPIIVPETIRAKPIFERRLK